MCNSILLYSEAPEITLEAQKFIENLPCQEKAHRKMLEAIERDRIKFVAKRKKESNYLDPFSAFHSSDN